MVIHVGDDDYEVGFRKPPRHSRFKPGQSGNPTGRKRSVQTSDWEDPLKAILQLKIPILWDGKRIRVPAFKALMMNTLKKALSGCTKSTKLLLDSTDGFKSIVAEEKRQITEADRAFLVDLYKRAGRVGKSE